MSSPATEPGAAAKTASSAAAVPPSQSGQVETAVAVDLSSAAAKASKTEAVIVSAAPSSEKPPTVQQQQHKNQPPRAAKAPPGYRLMKAKKKDGSIVTVRIKLTPEELAAKKAAGDAVPAGGSSSTGKSTSVEKSTAAPSASLAKTPTTTETTTASSLTAAKETAIAAVPSAEATSDNSAAQKKPAAVAAIGDKPAASAIVPAAAADEATGKKEAAESTAEPDAAQLAERRLQARKKARSRFKSTLLSGLARTTAGTTIDVGDLGDHNGHGHGHGDDDGYSDDDDYYDDDDDDSLNEHTEKGATAETEEYDANEHELIGDGNHAQPAAVHVNTGAIVGGLAATAAVNASKTPAPAAAAAAGSNSQKKTADKFDFKVTDKDLKDIDEKAEAAVERPLTRHWANISFYLIASLSIVLPLLTLGLGIAIAQLDNRPVASTWKKVPDAIKVAVSAWPIIFAAVAAQAFKTWATFRVERGVKLLELEQLVGSNSFASAIKQPFLLRTANLLALSMFVVWCLSPLGSQALQRTIMQLPAYGNDTVEAHFLNLRGANRLLSEPRNNEMSQDARATLTQTVAVYYIASFRPWSAQQQRDGDAYRDSYNNPLLTREAFVSGENGGWFDDQPIAAYGVPIILPDPMLAVDFLQFSDPEKQQANAASGTLDNPNFVAYEGVTFPVVSSFFNLTCGAWRKTSYVDLDESMYFSSSFTMGLAFGPGPSRANESVPTVRSLVFASQINPQLVANASADNDAQYFAIDCSIEQVFFQADVFCDVDSSESTSQWVCQQFGDSLYIPAEDPSWYTDLGDFAYDWVTDGNPSTYLNPTTPTERYAETLQPQDGTLYGPTEQLLSAYSPQSFSYAFGFLLNTWTNLAFCPECVSYNQTFQLSDMPAEVRACYTSVLAKHEFSIGLVYKVHTTWLAVYMACSAFLLLVGALSVYVESLLIAPDSLGYVSSVVRNSRHIKMAKTATSSMGGGERARRLGSLNVMMQDVKYKSDVGQIALGLKTEDAHPLSLNRMYR